MLFPMQKLMTFYAQWHNGKPLSLPVAGLVVILLCGCFLALDTLETGCLGKFSANDSIIDSIFCFPFRFIGVAVFSMGFFPGRTFCKFFIVSFAFFAVAKGIFSLPFQVPAMFAIGVTFVIFLVAFSAISLDAKCSRGVLVKFRKLFFGIALRASFCYNVLRHGFFLTKKLCLEPLQAQYLCGSFYYSLSLQKYNQKIIKFWL